MAKAKLRYICSACGTVHSKWSGQCDGCGSWDTLHEESAVQMPQGLGEGTGMVLPFTNIAQKASQSARYESSITEFDRVLGGGFVPGSATLIGGDPGIGKSTLLLQAAAQLASENSPVAYISGEESTEQVQLRAQRLGLANPHIHLAHATSVRDILASLKHCNAKLAVIDSIQTMFVDSVSAAPGTVSQVRSCSSELIHYAKTNNVCIVLVGHVTKEGQIAGPRVMEHMVDTVLYFEGDRSYQFRILRAVKNRFGATDEIGVFHMAKEGLIGVDNPSSLFVRERNHGVSGIAVFPAMEGTRPVLVDIEALIASSNLATPRRAVVGWDSNRLAMILAVLETRAGLQFSDKEVYLNISGGLRVNEPAGDAAVAAALISSLLDKATPNDSVFFGEIGLSGELRSSSHQEQRLKEAKKLGFSSAYTPQSKPAPGTHDSDKALGITPLNHVEALVQVIREQ